VPPKQLLPTQQEYRPTRVYVVKVLMRGGCIIVVPKAFKFQPIAKAVEFWLEYLRELRVRQRA
jgi:hypothetical protein